VINLILVGFVAVFLLSYLVSGRVGARRSSAVLGMLAGVATFCIATLAYLTVLFQIARAWLIEFLQTRLPQMMETIIMLLDRFTPIRETI